jgi:SAM-dependent methyltransferase
MDQQTIDYYSRNAVEISDRYESIVNSLAIHFERAFANGRRVLDIGCGSGRDLAYLQRLGKDVCGIDGTPELVERAQLLHPELKGRIICGTVPEAPIPFGGAFDGILCSAVLMHIPLDLQRKAVTFIKQCLRPGGHLLYSVPSKRLDVASASSRDAAGRLFIPDSQSLLQGLLEEAGFTSLDRWGSADSLGRDEVAWESVLMRLGSD